MDYGRFMIISKVGSVKFKNAYIITSLVDPMESALNRRNAHQRLLEPSYASQTGTLYLKIPLKANIIIDNKPNVSLCLFALLIKKLKFSPLRSGLQGNLARLNLWTVWQDNAQKDNIGARVTPTELSPLKKIRKIGNILRLKMDASKSNVKVLLISLLQEMEIHANAFSIFKKVKNDQEHRRQRVPSTKMESHMKLPNGKSSKPH